MNGPTLPYNSIYSPPWSTHHYPRRWENAKSEEVKPFSLTRNEAWNETKTGVEKKKFHLCELIVWSDTLTTLFYKRNVQVLITFPRSRGQGTSNIKIQPWPSLLSVYHLIWCGWKSWKKTYWRGTDWDRYRAGSGNPVMWLLWTLTGFSSNSQQLGWRGQGNPVVLKAIQTVGPSVVSHPLT